MEKNTQQTGNDRPKLTRSEVAKILGRDVSYVRRHEGKTLHPTVENGVKIFDPVEVEALRKSLEAEREDTHVSEESAAKLDAFFECHALNPGQVSQDGIVERTGLDVRAVRAAYKRWAAERQTEGTTAPPLLSRDELQAQTQREVDAVNNEYDERLARWKREDAERHGEFERERKKREAAQKKQDQERERQRAARRHLDLELIRKTRKIQAPPPDPFTAAMRSLLDAVTKGLGGGPKKQQ